MSAVSFPEEAAGLLDRIGAPPALRQHLALVHEAAAQLTDAVARLAPGRCDGEAVRFGAATHDIGKALHHEELRAPGRAHERAGEAWMLARGVSPARARFARTHGLPPDDPSLALEDLLVQLADRLWKGRRDRALEERVARACSDGDGASFWACFLALDEVFMMIALDGDARLRATM